MEYMNANQEETKDLEAVAGFKHEHGPNLQSCVVESG